MRTNESNPIDEEIGNVSLVPGGAKGGVPGLGWSVTGLRYIQCQLKNYKLSAGASRAKKRAATYIALKQHRK